MGAKISSDMTVSRKITPCSDIAVSAEIITSSEIMVAASIFMDDSKFSNIKGVQMRGKIEEISKTDNMGEVISLASAYIKKFGIPFNESGGAKDKIDALAFIRQHYRSQLYRFIPSEMIYMDNSIHIGFKQKIELT
jgi:hypothetical protein